MPGQGSVFEIIVHRSSLIVLFGSRSVKEQKKSRWRSGDFDRKLVPEIFHRFVPAHAADSLQSIDLDRLWSGGKRLILLDVDHTLVKWKAMDFAQPVLEWIGRAKTMGFGLCIISNTRRVHRLQQLSQTLGVETVRGRFKPSRAMFRLALIKFKRKPEEAVMIGDQLMTDILGANRAGIDAIWVRKMEGKEFAGTRINRFMERILQSAIYQGLITPIDESKKPGEETAPLKERSIFHQIVKFTIVGGSSFIIDFAITWFLTFHSGLAQPLGVWLQDHLPLFQQFKTPEKAAVPIFVTVAAAVAIVNSFIWNRLWTFEIRGKEERTSQFRRFVIVSVIGLLLNVAITSALNNVLPTHKQISLAIAKAVAAIVVAVWNFTGQRLYAFKPRNT